jgi:TldD protein
VITIRSISAWVGSVTGHDFSRAENERNKIGALAPARRWAPQVSLLRPGIAILLAASISVSVATAQQTRADAEKDPVLKAMLAEMDRSKSGLQLTGFQKPFFIEFRIEDATTFETRAEFGSSESSENGHQRVARVTVRVGDYKTDSSTARGDGAVEITTIDDDPIALRSALWSAADTAYKAALDAYAQKQAELKQIQTPPQADDFSHEKPLISLAAPAALNLNEQAQKTWADRVAGNSGLYRNAPTAKDAQVQYCVDSFSARAVNKWLVNSEGTIVRKSATSFEESFGVGTQAADGMRITRTYSTSGKSLTALESQDDFSKHSTNLIGGLADLRNAPLVEEEYHGPVLFSSHASAEALHSLMAAGFAATRPRLGTEARTNGAFASSFHARVLPDFMSVVDDPTLKTFNGKDLAGAYEVDDEGVAAQSVQLVTAGKLENYLVGREPVRDFPQSNGHTRATLSGPARPVIGVLKISADNNGLSDDDLNKKLLDMAKDRDLKSVYFIATLGSGLSPHVLYRVSVADGKRELVRGAALADLDQRALRSGIEAAGSNLYVSNRLGDVPETVLTPALLLSDVTVKRANEKNNKLPYYPPPD